MQVRLLLGPAGSGKTFRCLAEVRQALSTSPDGPPLLLVVPRQTTYQLERQFLTDSSFFGYTRLQIVSFERLAHFIFERLQKAEPKMLDEEGRVMVLRSLLAKKRDELKLFRASARLTGFAQQLSEVLRELQRNEITSERLKELAGEIRDAEGLSYKLHDLGLLLHNYLEWLQAHHLQDADSLLAIAAGAMRTDGGDATVKAADTSNGAAEFLNSKWRGRGCKSEDKHQLEFPLTLDHLPERRDALLAAGDEPSGSLKATPSAKRWSPDIGGLWVDGFSEWSPQELNLLMALIPHCDKATLTFCLDQIRTGRVSWLSNWSVPQQAFEQCKQRLLEVPGTEVAVELLKRDGSNTRFAENPILRHLEASWPIDEKGTPTPEHQDSTALAGTLRLATCVNPEAEAVLAAREIISHARRGGRYRDVAVLVRKLENYHQVLQRIFSRYQIPFFLDRRELVSHHPLAELTRSALRTVTFHWQRDDWFAALKTGLIAAGDKEIDELENEALARGWKGSAWHEPIRLKDVPKTEPERQSLLELESRLERLRRQIMPAFQKLALMLGAEQNRPTGPQLAAALRAFWKMADVEQRLEQWATGAIASADLRVPNSVHATVWSQMNEWLDNIEMAFPDECLPLREWLPILDAGLANLTVGVIPPALDQVLIGAIDRTRNADVKLALVLGMNETVFPARPEASPIFTEPDSVALEKRNIALGMNRRHQLARERHYGYLACSRARERLVITSALHDLEGTPLNPSPFITRLYRVFPALQLESVPSELDWRKAEHATELIAPLLRAWKAEPKPHDGFWEELAQSPALSRFIGRLSRLDSERTGEVLSPTLAEDVYGSTLRTSVSRMEQFAACPFKFFVHSGLRAEERKVFELDVKEKGTLQHDILAEFHNQLRREKLRWRDISPEEARARVGRIAQGLIETYRNGLLQATEESRFAGKMLTRSLQDFIGTLVGWMGEQYRFDPVAVELPFGEEGHAPWRIELGENHRLELYGRIDRVDLWRNSDHKTALCVVVDYKSSRKQLDRVLLAHGLQLQLLGYLNVLRKWTNARSFFGVEHLMPAGVFYVNLHGKYERGKSRLDALADQDETRMRAYRHTGRFDVAALPYLDGRRGARNGNQFNYRMTNQGELYRNSRECLPSDEFLALLDIVEANLKRMGAEIFSGNTGVAPYRKGAVTACDQCDYRAICRIDPWTHQYRLLKKLEEDSD